jgi:hypothetical protein
MASSNIFLSSPIFVKYTDMCSITSWWNIEQIFRSVKPVCLHYASSDIKYKRFLENPNFHTAKTPTALVSFGELNIHNPFPGVKLLQ